MSTRISSLALLGLLAACGGEAQPQAREGAQRIDCAVGPGTQFAPDCLVERERRDGETVLVVRRTDGGFRRFVQLADGASLEAADGADAVTSNYRDGVLEVSVGQERYRFPARDASRD